MSSYLQRLYEAGGAPTAALLRPAQRGGSPLIAIDQRLARPEFAGDFGFGATPSAYGGGEDQAPQEGGDREALDERSRELRFAQEPVESWAPQPDVGAIRPRTPDRHPASTRPPSEAPPVVEIPSGFESAIAARPAPPATAARRRPTGVVPVTSGERADLDAAPTGLPISRPRPSPTAPEVQRLFAPSALAEPVVVSRPPGRLVPMVAPALRAAPSTHPEPPPPVVLRADLGREIQPSLEPPPALRPPPVPAPAPLPPAASELDWRAIEARIRAMIEIERQREARASAPAAGATSPATEIATQPRPTTAEAASVIGKIERPPRHSILFGARLR